MKGWSDLEFWNGETWKDIQFFLKTSQNYYPEKGRMFAALQLTPLKKVRAVILGQDPYHDGSATGLAFSCNKPFGRCRPSLKNILREYNEDLKLPIPDTGDLSPWAKRGVLLLNTCLSVEPHKAGSHNNIGWQELTKEIVSTVHKINRHAVFILWGKEAQELATPLIGDAGRVSSPHPSPYSANSGFFGSRPFTKTNALLSHDKVRPIDWHLP